jgi:TolB-like protein/Tfp pilus assembly protein PilF
MTNTLSEFKRRNIFRVAGVYAVAGWLLAQLASVLESSLNMPGWFDTVVVSLLLICFPVAMILAWAFEMTPEGFKKTQSLNSGDENTQATGRKLDYVLIGGLALVGLLIIADRAMPKVTVTPNAPVITAIDTFTGQSIAVLPFEDFSPNKDQEYFADGIAEELLNVLARVEGLRVTSRTSAFSYKGREASIAEIGKALNVAHILEGSVRKAGDTLRITAQLIDTASDEHMWSETYDRPLTAENVFEIQDEISKAIVLELNGRLDLLPETSIRATQSTEALEAYLKGKEAVGPRSVEGIETGITELIRAVTLDPAFAVAHAKLSRAYHLANEYADMDAAYADPRSEIHMDRALALAPTDWDVLAEYAWFLGQRRFVVEESISLDQVVAAFDTAIAANPNNAEAHRGKGWTLAETERLDEARSSLERAMQLNPRHWLIKINAAGVARRQGNIKEFLKLATEAVRLNPTATLAQTSLSFAYQSLGDIETAHRVLQSCRVETTCASDLGNLLVELGIEFDGSKLLTDYTLLRKFYAAGQYDAFAQLVATLNGVSVIQKVYLYHTVGAWDEAYRLIQDYPAVFEPLFQGVSSGNSQTLGGEIALLAVLQSQDDPRAKGLRATLAKKYQGVVPGEHIALDIYYNGAAWQMLEGDLDGAMVWLNAMADQGRFYFPFTGNHVLFDPLKSRADYQAFRARMASYHVRDRALIEAQIANPPEVWWSPDELEAD